MVGVYAVAKTKMVFSFVVKECPLLIKILILKFTLLTWETSMPIDRHGYVKHDGIG
jgi:hypothetical protein